jgi:DNA-binding IclR family transcriptional regulator
MTTIRCFIFNELRGAHPSWSLAVMAVSEKDARQYVRAVHGSGKLTQRPQPGATVTASCGATTEAAQAFLRERNEREYQRWIEAREQARKDHPQANDAQIERMVEAYF